MLQALDVFGADADIGVSDHPNAATTNHLKTGLSLLKNGSSRIQVGASAVKRCMKGSPDNGFRESSPA